MEFLWFILVGLIAGWLAGLFVRGSGYGVLGDIVLGIVGALIGGFIFRVLGFTGSGSLIGSIIVAFIGAVILLFLLHFFSRRHPA